ncbi:MAG: MlaE family lipid ABC transporter permease subunit [Bdellovibrionota bacterium]
MADSWFKLEATGGKRRLLLHGSWRLPHVEEISAQLRPAASSIGAQPLEVDASELDEIDTAGALLLFRYLLPKGVKRTELAISGLSDAHASIINLVKQSYQDPVGLRAQDDIGFFGKVGQSAFRVRDVLMSLTSFFGELAVEVARTVRHPRILRAKELFVQLELSGIDAIPIVCLVTFLIGIVVAYLFGIQIQKYGANIFIVDAVGLAMCRELSPILVAIILAGRSGSAFTAQIGTMKLNEEVDAMITLGLSPMSVLVVPRVFALMLAMPLLVFVGDLMGIIGSMVIADLRLDITGVTFLQRLQAVLPVRSFFVGLFKAPVFALFIGVIGCRMGFAVENNARSVGLNTTSTVVRSIVAVILLNAAFAVIFQELKI